MTARTRADWRSPRWAEETAKMDATPKGDLLGSQTVQAMRDLTGIISQHISRDTGVPADLARIRAWGLLAELCERAQSHEVWVALDMWDMAQGAPIEPGDQLITPTDIAAAIGVRRTNLARWQAGREKKFGDPAEAMAGFLDGEGDEG